MHRRACRSLVREFPARGASGHFHGRQAGPYLGRPHVYRAGERIVLRELLRPAINASHILPMAARTLANSRKLSVCRAGKEKYHSPVRLESSFSRFLLDRASHLESLVPFDRRALYLAPHSEETTERQITLIHSRFTKQTCNTLNKKNRPTVHSRLIC